MIPGENRPRYTLGAIGAGLIAQPVAPISTAQRDDTLIKPQADARAASALYVGTAGWTVPTRYAGELPLDGTHLERYAGRFDAVEINSSFYRSHKPETYARWASSVPPHFRFSVKLPRAITHERRLVGCDALVARFGEEVAGLGTAFGALLVQLPPSLAHEAGAVEDFFIGLRRHIQAPVVCEPRHATWFTPDADMRLRALQVARVAADPPPVSGADDPGGWNGLIYHRLHGSPRIYYSDYDTAALAAIRQRLVMDAARNVPVWCIFDNTAAFAAMGNAMAVFPDKGGTL